MALVSLVTTIFHVCACYWLRSHAYCSNEGLFDQKRQPAHELAELPAAGPLCGSRPLALATAPHLG